MEKKTEEKMDDVFLDEELEIIFQKIKNKLDIQFKKGEIK